jgi:hypothetical protein
MIGTASAGDTSMWKSALDFVVDIIKKLIVAVVAAAITAIAAMIYFHSIAVGLSSFGGSWWNDYWYLPVALGLLKLLEGYFLYKYRGLFPVILGITFISAVVFSLYRLNVLPAESVPLVVFFCLFVFILFNTALVVSFIVWRIVANIASQSKV